MPDAFVAFYEDHYGFVLATAQRRLRGISDAENVAAEVFRVAWAHYRESGEITIPWVQQALRNLIGNEYRRQATARSAVSMGIFAGRTDTGPADLDDAVIVRQALATLAESDREVLLMAYWEDLSREEMGEILGCATGTVRVRLHRARERLQQRLISIAGDEFGGRERHG